jgi:hypothetical protein
MCDDSGHGAAFAEGLAEVRTGRRTLLTAGAAGLAFSTVAGAEAAAVLGGKETRRRAYVLVLDGCRPDEINRTLMPNVSRLRRDGLNHPFASSLPVMETIPNHVMMMTGVRPDRSGVPANTIFDRRLGRTRDMSRPSDIRIQTVIQRLNRSGLRTGTVLSKEYLYGVFGGRATHRWEPSPVIPISRHAPDLLTMQAALTMMDRFDPHLMFVNLGDIDRLGHTDLTGSLELEVLRKAALLSTDRQVGRFVDHLKATGRWRRSLVIVLADHAMDWSLPHRVVHLQPALDDDPLLAGKVRIAGNGGADLLYWTGSDAERDRAVRRMIRMAESTSGVLQALDVSRADSLRLGRRAGDVVVFCRAGWRFTDPEIYSNPIPGNHGHPATRAIPFLLAGGHPVVPRGRSSSAHATTLDVAPTLSEFFGVGGPRGGYDGRSRLPRD